MSLKFSSHFECLSISIATSDKETDFILDKSFKKVSVITIIEYQVYRIFFRVLILSVFCSIYHRITALRYQT